jgi:hypothetical protein
VSPVKYELGFYIPEDCILHSHCRENLKSYMLSFTFISEVRPNKSSTSHTITAVCVPLLADDPYYCGLRARVPNFVKSSKGKDTAGRYPASTLSGGVSQPSSMVHQFHQYQAIHHPQQQPVMWHARSFDSGMGVYTHLTGVHSLDRCTLT